MTAGTFSLTNKMTDEEFASFTDPQNYSAQILLSHFFVLDHIIENAAMGTNCFLYSYTRAATLSGVEKMAARMPLSYKKYLVWPLGCLVDSKQT